MADSLYLIAITSGIGGAIGGGASKFVKKAWDSGEKWIASYFNNHQEKAKEKAISNSIAFLNDLAKRISKLEDTNQVSKEQIVAALEQPDFSVTLQKAMLSAAQTENSDKHQLLSRLIAERIKSKPESIMALASKLATEAISFTTPNQLRILGLTDLILHISLPNIPEQQFTDWLQFALKPFLTVKAGKLDYLHLESLSCLKYNDFLIGDLQKCLNGKLSGTFDYEQFIMTDSGLFLEDIWSKQKLNSVQLTSIGQILGAMIFDQLCKTNTNMTGWE